MISATSSAAASKGLSELRLRSSHASDLADILACRGLDLFSRRRRLEATQLGDVSAHATIVEAVRAQRLAQAWATTSRISIVSTVTPGDGEAAGGGRRLAAWASVSNSTTETPFPSTGPSQ